MRSASSCALRSASAKSIGATAFLAPRPPSLDFLAGAELGAADDVLVIELDDVKREAPNFPARPEAGVELERKDDEEIVRGAGETMEVVDEAAEAERPMVGGGEVGGDKAGVPGFELGLSHDVKKSSSSACDGGVGEASMPSTKMRSGYLWVD
jgi:hypothetical protein